MIIIGIAIIVIIVIVLIIVSSRNNILCGSCKKMSTYFLSFIQPKPSSNKWFLLLISICTEHCAVFPKWSVAVKVTVILLSMGSVGPNEAGLTVREATLPELSVTVGGFKPDASR